MDGLLLAPPGTQPGSENDTQGHKHLFITSDKEAIAVGVVRCESPYYYSYYYCFTVYDAACGGFLLVGIHFSDKVIGLIFYQQVYA